MLVLRTTDNSTFELSGIIVQNAKELKRLAREGDKRIEEGATYYPVTVGEGVQVEPTTAIKVKGVTLHD